MRIHPYQPEYSVRNTNLTISYQKWIVNVRKNVHLANDMVNLFQLYNVSFFQHFKCVMLTIRFSLTKSYSTKRTYHKR